MKTKRPDMLRAPIKKNWFEMTLSGEKQEEYRDITDYWITRIANVIGIDRQDVIKTAEKGNVGFDLMLTMGYGNDCPHLRSYVFLGVGIGNPKWGASGQKQFIFRHRFFIQICFGQNRKTAEQLENVFFEGCLPERIGENQ